MMEDADMSKADISGRIADHVSLIRHMNDFSRGVLDSRHLVFYVSGTVLFLFLTTRVVEARRWKRHPFPMNPGPSIAPRRSTRCGRGRPRSGPRPSSGAAAAFAQSTGYHQGLA